MKTLVKAVPSIEKAESGFKLVGKIVANHDRAQYFKAMKLELVAPSLKDLQARQKQFIDESATGESCEFSIGGGNWSKFQVFNPEGVLIGRMSYNGRIWDANDQEIVAL